MSTLDKAPTPPQQRRSAAWGPASDVEADNCAAGYIGHNQLYRRTRRGLEVNEAMNLPLSPRRGVTSIDNPVAYRAAARGTLAAEALTQHDRGRLLWTMYGSGMSVAAISWHTLCTPYTVERILDRMMGTAPLRSTPPGPETASRAGVAS